MENIGLLVGNRWGKSEFGIFAVVQTYQRARFYHRKQRIFKRYRRLKK